jgi:thioredoxin-dependent peroxiredoxin
MRYDALLRRVSRTSEMLGKPVPDFSLPSTGGSPFRLSSARGRKLVLYFYPKDNTPGCTTEGAQFRDHYKEFGRAGCEVLGISRDSLASHERFKEKMRFPFELLADPEEAVCKQFGVMKQKLMYGKKVRGIERSTFVIDEEGVLAREWRGVKVPGHIQEVLNFVKAL